MKKFKVLSPSSFRSEREYIINVILNEFLGLQYDLLFDSQQSHYSILVDDNELVIQDHFFSKFDESYLEAKNIPETVNFFESSWKDIDDVPVIFGKPNIITKSKKIICGLDIFSSCFFMLTRWEEYVNTDRDSHDRFPAQASLAYKNKFLSRPVVDEYVNLIWQLLKTIGLKQDRKITQYKIHLSHDIDEIKFWGKPLRLANALFKEIFKRNNIIKGVSYFKDFVFTKKDPYLNFNTLMDLAEKYNLHSEFYFMSGGLSKYDNHYAINNPTLLPVFSEIIKRGHIIGFHPSYMSFNDQKVWTYEKELLEKVTGVIVNGGRQHYLRFQVPHTWKIWADSGMVYDSTLGYPDEIGFRCGTCHKFSVFDIEMRQKLPLLEIPLLVMDTTLFKYQNKTKSEIVNEVNQLVEQVYKHRGTFTLLWHNTSFYTYPWYKYEGLLEILIQLATDKAKS